MKPVIALVGRPNVGKSTLFNCLTQSRDALVADSPGLTRDRKYGECELNGCQCIVIDTGGLYGGEDGIEKLMARQVWQAIEEADRVLFITDARDGLLSGDQEIAQQLRRANKQITLVVNKIDGVNEQHAVNEFYPLGLGEPQAIAASHGRGVANLLETLFPNEEDEAYAPQVDEEDELPGIKIAVIGKPNVGKSTLVNRLLGEERVLTFDLPGTTRDSVSIPFERDGVRYTLIDTAGVRRKRSVDEKIEKFSVVKALQAVEEANVVLFVIDASQGISDQDAHLLGFICDQGRALIVLLNKWDGLSAEHKERVKSEYQRKLMFAHYAQWRTISALHGTGVGKLYSFIHLAYESATREFSASRLTRILEDALEAHPAPLIRGRRIKLRYAHQGGRNPPRIVIHGNQVNKVPANYRRYLMNTYIHALGIQGSPVRIEFKTGDNPYAGKRNALTPRQRSKKQRLKKYVQKQKKRARS